MLSVRSLLVSEMTFLCSSATDFKFSSLLKETPRHHPMIPNEFESIVCSSERIIRLIVTLDIIYDSVIVYVLQNITGSFV